MFGGQLIAPAGVSTGVDSVMRLADFFQCLLRKRKNYNDKMNPDLPNLFIFDDLAGDREFQDIIHNFYSKGRPNNCMCIYITQQFSEIQPKSIRDNCSNLILFKIAGCSFDKVYSDMAREVMENKKEFKILCERIWRDKYVYVYINKIDDFI